MVYIMYPGSIVHKNAAHWCLKSIRSETQDHCYTLNRGSFPEHFTVTLFVETDVLNEMICVVIHIFMEDYKKAFSSFT